MTHQPDALLEKALEVHRRLIEVFGEREKQPNDPMATLVSTIISQNTNDVLRDRAFDRLQERFPTWEEVNLWRLLSV